MCIRDRQETLVCGLAVPLCCCCTACCTEITVRCRQIQYVLHLSTPHLRTWYGFFFSLCPWRLKSSGALVFDIIRVRTRNFSESSHNIHHTRTAFARELEEKKKHQAGPTSSTSAAAAAAAAAAAVEKQVFGPTLIRAGAKDGPPCFVLRQSPSMPRRS